MGSRIDLKDGHEIHNGFLAVLVQLGVLGLVGFVGICIHPLLRRAPPHPGHRTIRSP